MSDELNSHPAAAIFPLMVGHEFHALIADIRDNDLREPITLHPDGTILDGRNRHRACIMAKVEPKFVEWDGQGTPEAFVISKNLLRRHLDISQRGMIAADLATLEHGQHPGESPNGGSTISQAAQALNVGERTVERAKEVKDNATPEVVAAVKAGDMTVSKAVTTIPKKKKEKSPRSSRRKTTDRSRKKLQSGYWQSLRDALDAINGLPDVDALVKSVPAKSYEQVSRRLPVVRRWLESFDQVWSTKMEIYHDDKT